jgi:stage IV sporulation protein FB
VLLTQPNETPYDLRFQLFGIPVRVHPFFWLLSFLMGFQASQAWGEDGGGDARIVILWVLAVFISILLHEMGHAVVIRMFGWSPNVTLYAFGGLASYNPQFTQARGSYRRGGNSHAGQIFISFAGPLAGFLLALLICGGLLLANRTAIIELIFTRFRLPGEPFENFHVFIFIQFLLFVNILWGLVNLLPVYPLDGGRISRELFLMSDGRQGLRNSLMLSVATGAGVAVLGLMNGQPFIGIMFGLLAYSSYQQISGGGRFGGSPW